MKKTALYIISLIMILSMTAVTWGADDESVPLSVNGELIMEDYSKIELDAADITVTDETVAEYFDHMARDLSVTDDDGKAVVPDITDQFIKDYSLIYFGVQLDTAEEAGEYIRSTLEESSLRNTIISKLKDITKIISYPEDVYYMAQAYAADELSFYAAEAGLEADAVAILSGYGSADDYIKVQTDDYVKTSMIIDYILEDQEIVFSDEERDAALEEYIRSLGYDAYYTVEEFKELSGETWVWLFTEFQYKGNLMYDVLKDNVSIVDAK